MDQVTADARLIYDYLRMSSGSPAPADAIFCLCSLDIRVASHAAQLYLAGLAPLLIFSGDSGKLTEGLFGRPEAEAFADVARAQGVPDEAILVEPRATNTGENIRFTHELLRQEGLSHVQSFILVQKPYMERRTYATFARQWPDDARFEVSSPLMDMAEYFDERNPRDLVINIMVGDLVRIREYPARGFQIEQDIPEDVWAARQRLIEAGYDKHLP